MDNVKPCAQGCQRTRKRHTSEVLLPNASDPHSTRRAVPYRTAGMRGKPRRSPIFAADPRGFATNATELRGTKRVVPCKATGMHGKPRRSLVQSSDPYFGMAFSASYAGRGWNSGQPGSLMAHQYCSSFSVHSCLEMYIKLINPIQGDQCSSAYW